MNAKTYRIPLGNDVSAMERLDKLKKTAERLGVPFPTVTVSEPIRTVRRDALTGRTVVYWWKDFTLEGEGIDRPVSYGGWKIIGQFNHQYPKVILNKLSDNINPCFIQRFEAENVSWCQHCDKKINRNNTYVIENEETHTQMLIGSSCMHHYVPHQKSVDAVMAYYLSVQDVFAGGDDDEEYGLQWVEKYCDTHTYLRQVFQVLMIGLDKKSDEFGQVLGHLTSGTAPKESTSELAHLVRKAREFKEDAESEMYHMKLFIAALSEDNEFNVRLKRMCEPGYHLIKDCNTVCWGAVKYYQYIHRPRKARSAQTIWVASEGDILELPVKFDKRVFLFGNQFGDTYLYSFKTAEGNIITWKTSYIDTEFLEGDMVIRGRVKELTEFRDVKQTQITRAKIRRM